MFNDINQDVVRRKLEEERDSVIKNDRVGRPRNLGNSLGSGDKGHNGGD